MDYTEFIGLEVDVAVGLLAADGVLGLLSQLLADFDC